MDQEKLALENYINNIYFQVGKAEKSPYEDNGFDLVMTRPSLHLFIHLEKLFQEMIKVLKWWKISCLEYGSDL